MFAAQCVNAIMVNPWERLQKMRDGSTACVCAARSLPPHLSSRHKAAHDAHEDALNAATLRLRVHEAEHTGRRDDERVSCGEHAAPQEALQLKRLKLELRAGGKGRRRLARALRMEEHGSIDEVARE